MALLSASRSSSSGASSRSLKRSTARLTVRSASRRRDGGLGPDDLVAQVAHTRLGNAGQSRLGLLDVGHSAPRPDRAGRRVHPARACHSPGCGSSAGSDISEVWVGAGHWRVPVIKRRTPRDSTRRYDGYSWENMVKNPLSIDPICKMQRARCLDLIVCGNRRLDRSGHGCPVYALRRSLRTSHDPPPHHHRRRSPPVPGRACGRHYRVVTPRSVWKRLATSMG